MRRLLLMICDVLSSRALPPLVVGFFLLLYIGIAFFTNDTLVALIAFTSNTVFLAALFALLPVNSMFSLFRETDGYLKRRRALNGKMAAVPPELFDETVELSGSRAIAEVESRLNGMGYKTRRTDNALAAWRGVIIFPARVLYLVGTFCLFAGILISLTTRISNRGAIIEGETISASSGGEGKVERIILDKTAGLILGRDLAMEIAQSNTGEGRRIFGLYPPSLYHGSYVYPRYLGIGLYVRFSAPDVPNAYETRLILNIYPPGKEESKEVPGTPYRIVYSLAAAEDGSDPFVTGRMAFQFKLLKGKDIVLKGSAPSGGEFVGDGYRLAFPDSRRLVVTDFIRDRGVLLIWAASVLFVVAGCIWLPIRMFFPRREMLFITGPEVLQACSRAEGGERRHGGVFHEVLDLLEKRRTDSQSSDR